MQVLRKAPVHVCVMPLASGVQEMTNRSREAFASNPWYRCAWTYDFRCVFLHPDFGTQCFLGSVELGITLHLVCRMRRTDFTLPVHQAVP